MYSNQLCRKCNMYLYTGCDCFLVEIIRIKIIFFCDEDVKISFSRRREQENRRDYSDGINDKFIIY